MNLSVLISELLGEDSSPLLKYDLTAKTDIPLVAKATIDVFYQLVRHSQAFEHLYKRLPDYIDKVYPAPRAIWINLLLELCPENNVKSLLNDLSNSFAAAIPLPTGLSIKFGSFRGIHMSKSFLEIFSKCRVTTTRLVLNLAGKSIVYPNMYQDYKTGENTCVDMLLRSISREKDQHFIISDDKADNDTLQHLIAGSSLLNICLTSSCLSFIAKTSILRDIISNITESLPLLLDRMCTVSAACEELFMCRGNFKNAEDEYKDCLMKITGTSNESELQFPLILYLSENEELNQLYVASNELNTILLQKEKEVTAFCLAFLYHTTHVRILIIIASRLILVILGIATDSCDSINVSSNDYISRYASLDNCFDAFNWDLFSQFIELEKRLFGVPLSRVLPSFLCRVGNKYQELLTRHDSSGKSCVTYDALRDLTYQCSVEETGIDSNELVTKLQLPSLCLRINSLCCCNSFYNNPAVLNRVAGYKLGNGEELWLRLLRNVLISLGGSPDFDIEMNQNRNRAGSNNMYAMLRQLMNKCGDDYCKNKSNPLGIFVNKLDFLHLINCDLESTLVNEILLLSSFEGIGVQRFRYVHPLGTAPSPPITLIYIYTHYESW